MGDMDVHEKTRRLSIRVTEEEFAQWKEAAWIRRESLSKWTRTVLTHVAGMTVEESQAQARAESRSS